MSYCRFSCMDFDCDLYVYDYQATKTQPARVRIHTANNRVVWGDPDPRPPAPPEGATSAEEIDHFMNIESLLQHAHREPIHSELAGQTWTLLPEEAADKLEELQKHGFRFPEWIIKEIRENGGGPGEEYGDDGPFE